MDDSVFLEGLRCDGAAHGGCQALCLIFWKSVWLKPADADVVPVSSLAPAHTPASGRCTIEKLQASCASQNEAGETIYSCQGTDVPKYTSPMHWAEPRQWLNDLKSGNLSTGLAGESTSERRLEFVLGVIRIIRALVVFRFNRRQMYKHGPIDQQYPLVLGLQQQKTPTEHLNIQAGELVQVRSKEEIFATLNQDHRNRGLWFDSEMLPYCGGIYRVLSRVNRIVEEKTGKLIEMKSPCLILEGVWCVGDFHRLCQRAIYSYWRENWVKRATPEMLPGKE